MVEMPAVFSMNRAACAWLRGQTSQMSDKTMKINEVSRRARREDMTIPPPVAHLSFSQTRQASITYNLYDAIFDTAPGTARNAADSPMHSCAGKACDRTGYS